jgi:hypothetical protein
MEGRRRVALEAELERLRDFRSGNLGDNAESESIPAETPPEVKTLPSCTIRLFS